MNKYSLIEVQDLDKWDAFVESSPQGTIFSNSDYLQHTGRKYRLFYVLRGYELKAGISLILSDDEKSTEIDDLVIYNGIMFVDDKRQKHVSAIFERFEITEYIINELDKKYKKIEMALSPHFEDTRPFLWHNYHSENISEKFSFLLKYTSYLNISELSDDKTSEFETKIYSGLERLRQRRVKESRKSHSITVNDFDPELFLTFYAQLLNSQKIIVPLDKLNRINNLIIFLLNSNKAKAFSIFNNKKNIIYKTLFCFDSKRAYSLFGAGSLDENERYKGTIAFWDAFKYLAKEKNIKEVDMEGVNSPKRGWFKLSFGGNLLPYFHILKKYTPASNRGLERNCDECD
jgi:hypothetical protein